MIDSRSRSRISFSPEGWIFLIILVFVTVGAVMRNVNLLIIMSGMMFAPLLLNWRIGAHVIRNSITRRLIPNRIHVGQVANFQWMFSNHSSVPVWHLGIQDEIRFVDTSDRPGTKPRRHKSKTQVVFNYVSVGQTEYSSFRSLFQERGVYEIGPAVVFSKAPFGLAKSWHRLHKKNQFFVAPRLGVLHPRWETRIASSVAGTESIRRQRGSEEDEFYALRQWRSGDNRRQIHWRTSAKYNQPMVKQFDQKTNRDLAIGLDLYCERSPSEALDIADELRVEQALSFGATVLAQLGSSVQGRIGMAVAGEKCFVDCERNHSEFVSLVMQELAIAQASTEPDIAGAINELMARVSPGTPVFIISSRPCPVDWLQTQFDPVRWQAVQTWMHWLQVDSEEFGQLFEAQDQSDFDTIGAMQKEVLNAST